MLTRKCGKFDGHSIIWNFNKYKMYAEFPFFTLRFLISLSQFKHEWAWKVKLIAMKIDEQFSFLFFFLHSFSFTIRSLWCADYFSMCNFWRLSSDFIFENFHPFSIFLIHDYIDDDDRAASAVVLAVRS